MPDPAAARQRRASPPALRGDEGDLYRAHAARLRATVAGRARASPDQVDDACALAWLILLRAQPRRESVFPWLVTVAEHEVWRLTRADREQAPLSPFDADTTAELPAAGSELYLRLHAKERLRAVAAALPERKRLILGLRALGYDHAEIADLTHSSRRTVDRRLGQAYRLLDPLREPLCH